MAILAQYTIRSKQSYIFRTNAMREITGASALIRDAWDVLFKKATDAGLITEKLPDDLNTAFDLNSAFCNGAQMVDLFRGGGNDTVLFKDEESMKLANAAFTRALLEECPGMIPMCAWVETGENYKDDYQKLMEASEREKNRMAPGLSLAMAPFSMMDRKTFQPIACVKTEGGREQQLTAEAEAKLRKFGMGKEKQPGDVLDDIGKLLAVVHADGNNMGQKIIQLLGKRTTYAECVPLMRKFTDATARAFTGGENKEPRKALETYAEEKGKDAIARGEVNDYIVRWIVHDGDDATFVCNANRALELTEYYLKKVLKHQNEGVEDANGDLFQYSSCAGICLFHSHYPFSMAYAMAEEACDSAKKPVHRPAEKKEGEKGPQFIDEAWIDFHFIHSGLSGDLADLREQQGTAERMARPWLVTVEDEDARMTTKKLSSLAERLRLFHGVTRTNIKALGAAWERSKAEGIAELHRVYSHARCADKLRDELENMFGKDENVQMKAIYDLAEVYDLWFRPKLEPIARMLECLKAKDAEMLERLIAPTEADSPATAVAKEQQESENDTMEKLKARIIRVFTRHDEENGQEKAELRAKKALTDLINITGWEDLLGKGE